MLRRSVSAAALWLFVAGVGFVTVAAAAFGSSPIVAVLPAVFAAILYATVRVPLRWSAIALLTILLTVDGPADGAGLWHSPFVALGEWLQNASALRLSGIEWIAIFLLGVHVFRGATGSQIDGFDRLPTARILKDFLFLYVVGTIFIYVNGLLRGGDVALWKLRNLLQVPLLFLLFNAAFRGPLDHQVLGRVIVFAALVRSAFAAWIQYVVAPRATGGPVDFATSHADSALFTVTVILLLSTLIEHGRRALRQVLWLLPPVLIGIVANRRRIAWIIVLISLAVMWRVNPKTAWKRRLRRSAILALPIVALYVAVGWGGRSSLFAPLNAFRTVSETTDLSTLWRDIENWNISMSIREGPVIGIGLGQEYTEVMYNGEMSRAYAEYRAWPHNSVLGLLLFGGLLGFTAIWLPHAVTVFLAVRSCRFALLPEDRTASVACLAAIVAVMVLAYGDLGLNFMECRVFMALAMAVTGKLAVATGAWPCRSPPAHT